MFSRLLLAAALLGFANCLTCKYCVRMNYIYFVINFIPNIWLFFGLKLAPTKYYNHSFLSGQRCVKQKVQRGLFWGPGAVVMSLPSSIILPFPNLKLPPLRWSHDCNHLVKLCANNFILSLDIISLIWFYVIHHHLFDLVFICLI